MDAIRTEIGGLPIGPVAGQQIGLCDTFCDRQPASPAPAQPAEECRPDGEAGECDEAALGPERAADGDARAVSNS